MPDVKRYYLVRSVDNGGMSGPVKTHAVRASLPDPEPNVTAREIDPASDLFDWQPRPVGFTEPPEYTPA